MRVRRVPADPRRRRTPRRIVLLAAGIDVQVRVVGAATTAQLAAGDISAALLPVYLSVTRTATLRAILPSPISGLVPTALATLISRLLPTPILPLPLLPGSLLPTLSLLTLLIPSLLP